MLLALIVQLVSGVCTERSLEYRVHVNVTKPRSAA